MEADMRQREREREREIERLILRYYPTAGLKPEEKATSKGMQATSRS